MRRAATFYLLYSAALLAAILALPASAENVKGQAAAATASLADATHNGLAAKFDFDLPAQPLSTALKQFADQAGIQILFEEKVVDGLQAPAIKAYESATQVLQALLDHTDLEYTAKDQTVVVRRKVAATPTTARHGTNLSSGGDTVRLAQSDTNAASSAAADSPGPGKKSVSSADKKYAELEEVLVVGVKPFTTGNLDLERTMDDVQPYYIFDARAIGRAGASNVEELLRRLLPMDATSVAYGQRAFVGGAQTSFNLRGLGSNQTLVLVNGRRFASSSFALNGGASSNQPDLNGIPVTAIDHIEVLPTSASAIYGASAVGGVINVVLKRNYSGGDVSFSHQTPFDADAGITMGDVDYGTSLREGKTQLMLSASARRETPLSVQDRPELRRYALRVLQNDGGPAGTYTLLGATPNIRSASPNMSLVLKPQYGGANLGSTVTFVPYGITSTTPAALLGAGLIANAGNQNPDPANSKQTLGQQATLGSALDNNSFLITMRNELTPNLELNTDFSYTGSKSSFSNLQFITQYIPASSPANPFAQDVNVTLPAVLDGLQAPSNSITRRFTAGFVMKLSPDWVLLGDYTWSSSSNSYSTNSIFYDSDDLANDVDAGTLQPFVDTTRTPFNITKYGAVYSFSGTSTLNDLQLRTTGPIWRWSAGAITLTGGLERRQEGFHDGTGATLYPNYPQLSTIDRALGKKQTIESAYAELHVPLVGEANRLPLVHSLELQLAARTERFTVYTGPDSVPLLPAPTTPAEIDTAKVSFHSTQPTLGLKWAPFEALTFRASYSGAFLAPTYAQLLPAGAPLAFGFPVIDPRRGGELEFVPLVFGGNPNLQPDLSKTWNAGVIFEPAQIPGLRLSADWYRIKKDNAIVGFLDPQLLLDLESVLPGRVSRDPAPPGDPYGVGPLTRLDTSAVNISALENSGIDFNVSYRKETARRGTFDFSVLGTYSLRYLQQLVPGAPFLDFNNMSNEGPLRLRLTSNLVWEHRNWTLGWTTHYFNSYKIYGPPVSSDTSFIVAQGGTKIASQVYHDALATYRFEDSEKWMLAGTEVQVGIENVFNKMPPFDVNSIYNYSTWGDIRLRQGRLMIKKSF